jgi:hypothetical protein
MSQVSIVLPHRPYAQPPQVAGDDAVEFHVLDGACDLVYLESAQSAEAVLVVARYGSLALEDALPMPQEVQIQCLSGHEELIKFTSQWDSSICSGRRTRKNQTRRSRPSRPTPNSPNRLNKINRL